MTYDNVDLQIFTWKAMPFQLFNTRPWCCLDDLYVDLQGYVPVLSTALW